MNGPQTDSFLGPLPDGSRQNDLSGEALSPEAVASKNSESTL